MGSDDAVEFDAATQTWTVREAWGADAIPGLPSKELAMAVAQALRDARGTKEVTTPWHWQTMTRVVHYGLRDGVSAGRSIAPAVAE